MGDERGFSVVELLIVVAIIGIIVAIAIPNLLAAISRGRQKRTMSDMRSIATAIEAYSVDHGFYPIGDLARIKTLVDGPYIRSIPMNDGWLQAFVVTGAPNSYTILSRGSDRKMAATVVQGTTTRFDCDIVYSNGVFVQWPEGMQTSD